MIRAQCIVTRGNRILLVKHRIEGSEWWCLPGGGVGPNESVSDAALRELQEECCVSGRLLRQCGHMTDAYGFESETFIIDIEDQEPHIGVDPEFNCGDQILVEVRWMALAEISERDRAFLWAAGLMSIPEFLEEVSQWGDDLSYPPG